jgi:hypothetical protein
MTDFDYVLTDEFREKVRASMARAEANIEEHRRAQQEAMKCRCHQNRTCFWHTPMSR